VAKSALSADSAQKDILDLHDKLAPDRSEFYLAVLKIQNKLTIKQMLLLLILMAVLLI